MTRRHGRISGDTRLYRKVNDILADWTDAVHASGADSSPTP